MTTSQYQGQLGETRRSTRGFTTSIRSAPAIILVLTGMGASPLAHGEFALNFSGTRSTSIVHDTSNITGQTPMTAVTAAAGGVSVTDPDTGIQYWHYVIGDPASGFAEEVYIQKGGSCYGGQGVCSASAGSEGLLVGGVDPFASSTVSGNATGNPRNVLIRMVLGGTWNAGTSTWTCDTAYCSEFVKASYANKAKITERINEPDFTSSFVLDMSAISYSNNSTDLTLTDKDSASTGASLSNAQSVIDPLTGNVFSSFDVAHDSQDSFVTGGKYTYTNGTGRLQSNGTYVYVDGGYNPKTVDYSEFFDDTVNNPWAYPDNKP